MITSAIWIKHLIHGPNFQIYLDQIPTQNINSGPAESLWSLLQSEPRTSPCRAQHQSEPRPDCFKVLYPSNKFPHWVFNFGLHLHKLHDKHESIFLQEDVLEIDQVWMNQFSHHLHIEEFNQLKRHFRICSKKLEKSTTKDVRWTNYYFTFQTSSNNILFFNQIIWLFKICRKVFYFSTTYNRTFYLCPLILTFHLCPLILHHFTTKYISSLFKIHLNFHKKMIFP